MEDHVDLTMAPYFVTAPLVQVRKQDGSYAHVYEGGVLPVDADPKHIDHLLAMEMVTTGPEPDPVDDEPDPDGKPAGNASQEEWAAYAVAHGMTAEEVEGMTRNDLRDRFQ